MGAAFMKLELTDKTVGVDEGPRTAKPSCVSFDIFQPSGAYEYLPLLPREARAIAAALVKAADAQDAKAKAAT